MIFCCVSDGVANCKYNGKTLTETKCQFGIRKKRTQESVYKSLAIVEKDRVLTLLKTDNNYVTNGSNWQPFLLFHCLDIKEYICTNSKIR